MSQFKQDQKWICLSPSTTVQVFLWNLLKSGGLFLWGPWMSETKWIVWPAVTYITIPKAVSKIMHICNEVCMNCFLQLFVCMMQQEHVCYKFEHVSCERAILVSIVRLLDWWCHVSGCLSLAHLGEKRQVILSCSTPLSTEVGGGRDCSAAGGRRMHRHDWRHLIINWWLSFCNDKILKMKYLIGSYWRKGVVFDTGSYY